MSRIANRPIEIPEGVTVDITNNTVVVVGQRGKLSYAIPAVLFVERTKDSIWVKRNRDSKQARAMQGLFFSLLRNAVLGVSNGWSKQLELVGTGYRASVQGKMLTLSVGYSHPVQIEAPEGIDFTVEDNTKIIVSGYDKQLVGQTAADIRRVRTPEPYKGRGIKYATEQIRRKPGKSAKGVEGKAE